MSEAEFADLSLKILVPGLIIFICFIIWDLGKRSKAGKFGMFVLFLGLGLSMVGFIFKEILISFLSSGH
ncbi:DUF2788 domain-containing protein [Neisseria sp. Ec49-e6-T10]|uniref:DUF2788 domain-containing protein n=1 Tax=Neisseria sp. Ec49-e6-T10 TaxID=3140744 RepID=UPI003EB6FDCA